jgi:hypothetical protein
MTMAHIAVNHKNFFLAKTKDSESMTRAVSALSGSASHHAQIDRSTCDSQKRLQYRRFLQSWRWPMQAARGFFAFVFARLAFSSIEVLRARSPCHVNASLRGTLFFFMRWCIRIEVHLDSRMHAAN